MNLHELSHGFRLGAIRSRPIGSKRTNRDDSPDFESRSSAEAILATKKPHFDAPHSVRDKRVESSPGRVAELDSLRGLAALVVVLYHLQPSLIPWGWAAVDLFFVLSGYLITSIIIKHGSTRGFLRNFYVRRGLRVWPLYYIAVGLVTFSSPILFAPRHWKTLPLVLTFTQNIEHYWSGVPKRFCFYLDHFWTLAIEEQFYLIWPAMILIAGRKRVLQLSLLSLAASIWLRSRGIVPIVMGSRADGLTLGGLLAAILARYSAQGPQRSRLIGFFGLTALLSMIPLSAFGMFKNDAWSVLNGRPVVSILAFSAFWFGIVGLIVCQCGRPSVAILRLKPLRTLGIVSYGLYVYHVPVILLANQVVNHTWKLLARPIWMDVACVPVCIAVAWLSWIFIERPILDLKERFNYGSTPTRSLLGARSKVQPIITPMR